MCGAYNPRWYSTLTPATVRGLSAPVEWPWTNTVQPARTWSARYSAALPSEHSGACREAGLAHGAHRVPLASPHHVVVAEAELLLVGRGDGVAGIARHPMAPSPEEHKRRLREARFLVQFLGRAMGGVGKLAAVHRPIELRAQLLVAAQLHGVVVVDALGVAIAIEIPNIILRHQPVCGTTAGSPCRFTGSLILDASSGDRELRRAGIPDVAAFYRRQPTPAVRCSCRWNVDVVGVIVVHHEAARCLQTASRCVQLQACFRRHGRRVAAAVIALKAVVDSTLSCVSDAVCQQSPCGVCCQQAPRVKSAPGGRNSDAVVDRTGARCHRGHVIACDVVQVSNNGVLRLST